MIGFVAISDGVCTHYCLHRYHRHCVTDPPRISPAPWCPGEAVLPAQRRTQKCVFGINAVSSFIYIQNWVWNKYRIKTIVYLWYVCSTIYHTPEDDTPVVVHGRKLLRGVEAESWFPDRASILVLVSLTTWINDSHPVFNHRKVFLLNYVIIVYIILLCRKYDM